MRKTDIEMIFQDDCFSLCVHGNSLAVTSIKNKQSGDEYVKVANSQPIFYLQGFCGDVWQRVDPIFVSSADNCLNVQFGKYQVFAAISFRTDSNRLSVQIEVINNDDSFKVCEVVGVNLYGLVLGGDYRENSFVYPHHAGEKTKNIIDEYKTQKYRDFFRAFVFDTDINTLRREINYCGLASMSFMYMYDSDNGLYFGSHDSSFPVTGLIVDVGKDEHFAGMSFRKHYDISKGERYLSGEYVIAVTTEDWHCAKQIYREYIREYLKFGNYPDYLNQEWGLNQCYNFKRQKKIENRFGDIPRMYDTGAKKGIKHMFLASWNRTGFDSNYPEYYPDIELGSPMDFVRGLEYIKDSGGISTLYINARIFDVKDDFHSTLGEQMAMKSRDLSNIIEKYGPETFTVNCVSDEKWKNMITDFAEFCIKGYGATGVYLDQLASAEPFACYNPEHSHRHIGEFNRGYMDVLSNLHDRITKYNEKSFILTENIGDIYASYTFANLTWNSPPYDEFFNLIKYIFPEFIQIHMVNPRKYIAGMEQRKKIFYRDMQRAFLLGAIIWTAQTTPRLAELSELYEYADKAFIIRRSMQEYIQNADFMDKMYIENMDSGIDATSFVRADGLLVVIGNISENQGQVSVKLPFEVKSVKSQGINGESVDVQVHSGVANINSVSALQYVFFEK